MPIRLPFLVRETSPDSTQAGGVVVGDDDVKPLPFTPQKTVDGPKGTFACLKQNAIMWGRSPLLRPRSDGKVYTIGEAGCLLTCLTMCANYLLGKSLTPPVVNQICMDANACSGPLVVVESLAKALGLRALEKERLRAMAGHPLVPTNIRAVFNTNKICILHVDLNADELHGDRYGDHFVVALQRDGDELVCADPAPGWVCRVNQATGEGMSVWAVDREGTPALVKHYRVVGVIPVSVEAP